MMTSVFQKLKGDNVGARARRGAMWSFLEFGGTQFLRLVSNLILARILFPEAFGLMALIQVVLMGLELFSDTGGNASIVQHKRGDERAFLDSAWTIQVCRGVLLWVLAFALAKPAALFYDQPLLATMLPVAACSTLILGLTPTSVATASRHLNLGRLATLQLGAQIISIVLTVLMAWILQSVWALIFGSLVSAAIRVAAFHVFLPGPMNRFFLEREAFWQIFHFGKWILLSSLAGFLISQGDRAILGLYISLRELGVYNIAYMLASIPFLLMVALQQKVVVPIYRMKPPREDPENLKSLFRARRMLALGVMTIAVIFAFLGPLLILVLYDDRYAMAGPIITLFSLGTIPVICLNSIVPALLGLGDSRGLFVITLITAITQTLLLFFLIELYGLIGAVLAPGIAAVLTYPSKYWYMRKHGVWDPLQDFGFLCLGLALCAGACLLHADQIARLVQGF